MLEVKRLECPHCGRELSGSGRYITRFCMTCLNHWIITGKGVRKLSIRQAATQGVPELHLPFWVFGIDNVKLADDIAGAAGRLREQTGSMAAVRPGDEREQPDYLDTFIRRTGMENLEMLAGVSAHRKTIGSREVDHLIETIREWSDYHIYVPAFISSNPFAYLKAGRLLTSRQPPFELEGAAALRSRVLCSVESREARPLVDFVFLASLPKSILRSGKMLEEISPEPSAPPELVNFPFRRESSSLISMIGGFAISSRLVQDPDPVTES
jgi:hypothetical protein